MAIASAYLTSTKNLRPILDAIRKAQAPKSFTLRFLEGLGYKSSSDRLIIGVLKSLGFLDQSGRPTERYFRYLDETESKHVLAEGLREAYEDLFQVNTSAHELTRQEVKNKLKTLSQGEYSDSVLDKMAGTFKALSEMADFSSAPSESTAGTPVEPVEDLIAEPTQESDEGSPRVDRGGVLPIQGLVYNIQIQLPESRDPAVFDALFRSLREHLFR